jgi:hypothetical protein
MQTAANSLKKKILEVGIGARISREEASFEAMGRPAREISPRLWRRFGVSRKFEGGAEAPHSKAPSALVPENMRRTA